jgi:hypothetical protein
LRPAELTSAAAAAPASLTVAGCTRLSLYGAAGGAINAWLCYAQWPEPIKDATFRWHVVPAGAIHGAVLALCSVAAAMVLSRNHLGARLLAAPVIGWVSGYASWIPLNLSTFDEPLGQSLAWPFRQEWQRAAVGPFWYFGLVAAVHYLCLVSTSPAMRRRLSVQVTCAAAAGTLGSLWWWFAWERWYFSAIHGAIWGVCVGAAAWPLYRTVGGEQASVSSAPSSTGL